MANSPNRCSMTGCDAEGNRFVQPLQKFGEVPPMWCCKRHAGIAEQAIADYEKAGANASDV